MSADRSLAKVIPPDRRRLRSGALVVAGMTAGALLLLLGQRVVARSTSASTRAGTPVIQRFAPVIDGSDVTSPRAGPVVSDGRPDFAFELVVEGPVAGIVIAHTDARGVPASGSLRWGTMDLDLVTLQRTLHGQPGFRAWQLAVTEGDRRLNDSAGSIAPLHGTHRLRMQLSPAAALDGGGYLRAYVIGPDRAIAASAPVYVPGEPTPQPAQTAPAVRAEPEPLNFPRRPFDRRAAVLAIDSVQLERCEKLAGGPSAGFVDVTFAPTGAVTTVTVEDGPIVLHPPAARCVTDEIKKQVRIPPFDGAPVRLPKTVWFGRQD